MLERMTVRQGQLPKALADVAGRENLGEAVVLSTCMRTEVYAVAEAFHGGVADVRNFLAELGFTAPEDFSDHLYSYYGDAAVAHLFRVACGLDSAVVGESEVLGQVRNAWKEADAEGVAGPVLRALFRHAVSTGRRARTETGIGRGTTSVSQAAVEMASARLGGLDGRRIMVLGAGDMGEGMAVALAGAPGVGDVLVANRTWPKAVSLAARVGGRAVELADIGASLESTDVLLTSTGASGVLLDVDDLAAVMAKRPNRPLLVVDIAVPRDVDPAAGELEGLTLLDMDDLRAFADAGLAGRQREVHRAQAIVDEEVARYHATWTAREMAPLVVALRRRAEALRSAELDRFASQLEGLDADQRHAVESLTQAILAKVLHEPTVRLKRA
ncbi:MAG: glutamyl-tRNA reductase, partial [Acidimicrobiales bacterium]